MSEPWLHGPIAGIPLSLMPVAHALLQAQIDINQYARDLSLDELWTQPATVPAVGFHLLHIDGSCDRLLSYTKGAALTTAQFDFLHAEKTVQPTATATTLILAIETRIAEILAFMQALPDTEYFQPRFVGRAQLPTNVFGLLFHLAEHTQRHVGALIVTAKIIIATRQK